MSTNDVPRKKSRYEDFVGITKWKTLRREILFKDREDFQRWWQGLEKKLYIRSVNDNEKTC